MGICIHDADGIRRGDRVEKDAARAHMDAPEAVTRQGDREGCVDGESHEESSAVKARPLVISIVSRRREWRSRTMFVIGAGNTPPACTAQKVPSTPEPEARLAVALSWRRCSTISPTNSSARQMKNQWQHHSAITSMPCYQHKRARRDSLLIFSRQTRQGAAASQRSPRPSKNSPVSIVGLRHYAARRHEAHGVQQ